MLKRSELRLLLDMRIIQNAGARKVLETTHARIESHSLTHSLTHTHTHTVVRRLRHACPIHDCLGLLTSLSSITTCGLIVITTTTHKVHSHDLQRSWKNAIQTQFSLKNFE